MYDIQYTAPGDIMRFQGTHETLKQVILIAGTRALQTEGEWSIVYKKTGQVVLKMQGKPTHE